MLVAVADGHGGKGYVRSDIGSRSAVAIAIDVLSELVGAHSSGPRRRTRRGSVAALRRPWR